MDRDAIIGFRQISKEFGSVQAVNEATFDILRGEFFSLLGPSGCGKTTLLRMVAGFEAPSSGEIYIDDRPMSATPPNARPVNMVFQNYAIFPHLDVRGNIAFGMRKSGLSKEKLNAKIDGMLELIKLPDFGSRKADQLSGGQRQRVALARALIKQPKVLLLDEPLGALDKKLREQMQIELRLLQQRLGITFLFVTHDQEEALTLSHRIAVMSRGDILEIASPADLYESPTTQFVADFIGTMNFFDGSVCEVASGSAHIDVDYLGVVHAKSTVNTWSKGSKLVVGIRPEKLQLSFQAPSQQVNVVEGRVGPSAYLGDRSHIYVQIDNREQPVSVALQNLKRSPRRALDSDQRVWLTWSEDSVVLLPPG